MEMAAKAVLTRARLYSNAPLTASFDQPRILLAGARAFRHAQAMTFWKTLPLCALLAACDDKPTPTMPAPAPAPGAASTPAAPAKVQAAPVRQIFWTDELLHTEIKHYNPAYEGGAQFQIDNGKPMIVVLAGQKVDNLRCLEGIPLVAVDLSDTGVGDLSPLKGAPLVEVGLERTKVTNLSPLKGAPIEKLYMSGTPVKDLSPLAGMPLVELNLVGTQVTDLSPLAQSKTQMLWLTDCPVANIAALHSLPLVSLTLHRTQVTDLSSLNGTSLQRLHIAETPVTDLSPLKGVPLTRLVFTPSKIKAGLDVARALPVEEIGTRFDDDGKDLQPPAAFWATQPPSVK